jgi:hypothetical protein
MAFIIPQIAELLVVIESVHPVSANYIRRAIELGISNLIFVDGSSEVEAEVQRQSEICREAIRNFIEIPCRSVAAMFHQGQEYGFENVGFVMSDQEPVFFALGPDLPMNDLENFLEIFYRYIDEITPPSPEPEVTKSPQGPAR